MGTRKVKDAKIDGKKIYLKGHAKVTYMSDGRTVEDAVNDKVDKVEGKQLSTEDFTTLLKQKLEGLSNYDDTAIQESVSKLRTDLDTLVSGDTTTAIKTFNEVIAFLDGLEDTDDLASIIASIERQIADKQDTLISGNNIKTINGESLLGEGNIWIEGGGGSVEIPIIEHGENDTTITIESNTYHKWGEVRELTISLGEPTDESVVNEYMFSFDNIDLTPRLTIDELMWEHGEYPEFKFLAKNVVKIMDGLAKIESFALSSIVLSDNYDLEGQKQAMQLYNTIESGNYSPGEYSTNGASIYVYVYLETEGRYINERVVSFEIPAGFPSYPLIVNTERGRQFYLTSNGMLYLV